MTQANQGSAMPGNGLDGNSPDGNFISRFLGWGEDSPERTALSAMEGHHEVRLSYRQLAAEAAFWQQYWQKQGFCRGDRVVMALQPGLHTYAITISLLGMGLVPVYIDVSMPRHHIRYVLEGSSAVAIIGLRRALRWHWLVPELKQCQRLSIDGPFPGVVALPVKMARLARDEGSRKLVAEACPAEAHGIISFTSENRGIPMGADRTHGSLQQLHLAMERFWPLPAGEVVCSCFPLLVLHNLSAGLTTVLPDIDFACPGQFSRKQAMKVLQQLAANQVTHIWGAPAFFAALCDGMEANNIRIPEIDGIMLSRAVVSSALAGRLNIRFPLADGRIVYGATEAEPVTAMAISDYLRSAAEPGYLVGRPVAGSELVVCHALEERNLSEADVERNLCHTGDIGEILVAGAHVLGRYVNNPAAAMEHKIPRSAAPALASVWHRTGDTGYLDDQGQLWLTGRIKDLVYANRQVIHPYIFEKQIDKLPGVTRSALIQEGADNMRLYLVCDEPLDEMLGRLTPILKVLGIEALDIYRITVMPVDRRHNSKVDRNLLRTRNRRVHATDYQHWTADL